MEDIKTAETNVSEASIADTSKETSDAQFDDGVSPDTKKESDSPVNDGKQEKQPQTKEQNSEYARKRREDKQKQKMLNCV